MAWWCGETGAGLFIAGVRRFGGEIFLVLAGAPGGAVVAGRNPGVDSTDGIRGQLGGGAVGRDPSSRGEPTGGDATGRWPAAMMALRSNNSGSILMAAVRSRPWVGAVSIGRLVQGSGTGVACRGGRRDFVLQPHWLYFSHAVRRDYLSRGNTGSPSSTPRVTVTSSSGRIAPTIHNGSHTPTTSRNQL
jgi:hypothetical protein